MFNGSPWKQNSYLVRIDYNEYLNCEKGIYETFKKTEDGYFNILFGEETIKNICENLNQ